jgi:hypothetical protein
MLKSAWVILALLLLLTGTVGCFMLAGNPPANLVYFVPSLAMCLIPLGCSIIGFGIRGPMVVLRSFAVLWGSVHAEGSDAPRILSACIGYVYGAGAFVFLASIVTLTAGFPELAASGLTENFGDKIAATTVSLIYTVVLAELVLRPLKHRLA